MDHYVVLGIAEDADDQTIRSAFRTLARRYHPDAGAGSSAVEFQRAREAYETLADPARRRCYDRQLRESRAQPIVVEELLSPKTFAEPLFSSRRAPVSFSGSSVTVSPFAFFDGMVEEFFASVDDDWVLQVWLCGRHRR
jgi:curved DNA-binding protein CbpA